MQSRFPQLDLAGRTFGLIDSALLFAAHAHHGQQRKYTGDPYLTHCIEVFNLVRSGEHTPDMAAAALLHDVVEDTSITLADIADEFGQNVARLVQALTDVEQGNRRVRKLQAAERLAAAPEDAQTVKLADLISNTSSIATHDANFAQVYIAEIEHLLSRMTGGRADLRARASEQVAAAKAALKRV